MKITAIVMAVSAWAVALGCSPLAPRPDYSKFFILSPISVGTGASAQVSTAATSQLALGVGPIYFPDYLRRLLVVTVTSPNEIDLSSDKYWAEPMDKNFARVLTEDLTQLLNTRKVENYPWSRNVHIDYQVVVDVQRFDTNSSGQSELVARWIIKDGATGKDLYASETRATVQAGSREASAAPSALSQDLATLSRDIALRIADLSQHRPVAGS
jgi:uncharacterized protein